MNTTGNLNTENISEKLNKLQYLYEFAPSALLVYSSKLKIKEANQKACELLNIVITNNKPVCFSDILTEESLNKLNDFTSTVNKTGKGEITIATTKGLKVSLSVIKHTFGKSNVFHASLELSENNFTAEENEFFLKAVFEQISSSILVTDLTGRILYSNRPSFSMFGLGRESLYKKDIRELTLDKEMINKSDMELLLSSQRESLRIEKLMIKLDGFFWGSCGVSAIFDSDRHPVYMLYLIQNITKQKALQEELITSREQLQNILDFVNSMIVVTNGSEMKNCNRNLLDFFGFSTLEEFMLEHKCICDFFITKEGYLPETRRGYWLKEVLKQKENGMSTKVAIYDRKTDSDRIYLVDTHPFPGEKYFYIVSFTDITDMESHKKLLESTNTNLEEQVQRRTKELMDSYNRLSANEEFLSTIFNMASIGISIVDSRGSYIRVNSKFCEMYKICENELIGSNFTDILQESIRPDFMRLFEKYRDGKIKRMMPEWTLKLADGTVMDVFLTARWVTMYDGHRYLISTHLDITDKNRLQLKQREQERMLVQQSKMAAMGEMIGAIAHQWKQPLNAIALIAQCFKDDYEYNELNADVIDEHVSEIMKQVDFMNNTIDDFRNFFKPSKRMKKFNLCSAVMDVLSLITPQLKSSYIEVITDESCIIKKDTLVKGYPNEFKQVVLNILANSKDAILEQRHKKKLKGTEAGKIFISLKSENSTLCALFRDNGGGIPHDVMVHLFEPYFTTKGGGTGIGLYMSKTIIEDKMKGRIEASNTEDGAEFRIYLSKCGEGEEE